MRARFVDNFYGSSQVDPRHTGSVMTLPTRRAAASINTAATACLRSGIWVFRGQGAYHWTFSLSLFFLLFNVIFCFLFDSFRLFVIIHGFCFLNSTERRYKATEVFKRIFCSFQFDSIHSRGILQFVYNRGGKWKIVFIECNSIPPVTVCACTFPLSYRGER